MHGIHGPLKKENVITTLQELVVSTPKLLNYYDKIMLSLPLFQTLHNDIPSVILDVLHIADAETSTFDNQNDDSKERINFCYIVKESEKVNLNQ